MEMYEKVLLICLGKEESEHIRRLLSSFEVETESAEFCTIDADSLSAGTENICLAVLRPDEKRSQPEQEIRQLRQIFSETVPILLLIPPDLTSRIREYLRSGADDYWVLPLDETAFSVRFYVLLEYGQSILHAPRPSPKKKAESEKTETSVLQKIISRFQDSLRYFSPLLLFGKGKDAPIARKWEKIRLLGTGGFGEVWLVRKKGQDSPAVAKIPHSARMNIPALRAAAILKRLSFHPNVVHLTEVVKEKGRIILIQEYIEGQNLQFLLEQGMERTEKEHIFLQLLSVMTHAHEHRIMHRDIKPENIIIRPSGGLKLIDFGIAKDLSKQSISKTVVGSRPFMAPEQFKGQSCLASDVWAMGVLLYLFLTETLPFYASNEKDHMDMILEMHPLPPRELAADISEELEAVMLRMLDKNPEKRYRNAGEVKKDLLRNVPDFGKKRGTVF
ncbi:MAG: serine/threonine-protein kinase [Desulfococcaceae bacterium]|jgi:serine/threonine protein kinase|nr:serine/threonine-protein kinase [Desulfococcaceae bacterium]